MTAPDLLTSLYRAFNSRDIDAVLAALHPDVDWPNGWEGGRMVGRDAVRNYWERQWAEIDPRVEPTGFATDSSGRTRVTVHQLVRGKNGGLILDEVVEHVYSFEDGLINRMEIFKPK